MGFSVDALRILVAIVAVGGGCSPEFRDSPARQDSGTEREPLAAPLASMQLEPPKPVRVLVGGDLMPHRPALANAARWASALAPLRDWFQGFDAVVANFEAGTADSVGATVDGMTLLADPSVFSSFRAAGITSLTAANNHACDAGIEGVRATERASLAAGLSVAGIGENPFAPIPLVTAGGKRVCVIAYTTFVNDRDRSCARSGRIARLGLSRADIERASEHVRGAKDSCDALVAIVHGGEEYVPQIERMIRHAEALAQSGADAVVFHHPHVPDGRMVIRGPSGRRVPVFLSVGNLVSNQGEAWTPRAPSAANADEHRVSRDGLTRLGIVVEFEFAWSPSLEVKWASHLVWNDHVRAGADFEVRARRLDASRDASLIAALRVAPYASGIAIGRKDCVTCALFDDPCWVERTGHRCG